MKFEHIKRYLRYAVIALLVVQVPWYFMVESIANQTQNKTTATVIRIASDDALCDIEDYAMRDISCQQPRTLFPVYEYFDEAGNRYEHEDRFFGDFKENNPLGRIFQQDVGDSATAYYTPDKPDEVVVMATPLAYTAWLIPLYIAIPLLLSLAVVRITEDLSEE